MKQTGRSTSEEASRDDARSHAKAGIASLARAFNHCGGDELAYRYTDEVQARFVELGAELVALIECGAIENNPGHARYLLGKAARENESLQSLIRKAAASARGRSKRRADQ
jgi:hypothetical protein